MIIRRLIWDSWNINHLKKHRVTVSEVEEACKKIKKSFTSHQNRLIILGESKNQRLLTIVLASKGKNQYYIVTARDTSRQERSLIK